MFVHWNRDPNPLFTRPCVPRNNIVYSSVEQFRIYFSSSRRHTSENGKNFHIFARSLSPVWLTDCLTTGEDVDLGPVCVCFFRALPLCSSRIREIHKYFKIKMLFSVPDDAGAQNSQKIKLRFHRKRENKRMKCIELFVCVWSQPTCILFHFRLWQNIRSISIRQQNEMMTQRQF